MTNCLHTECVSLSSLYHRVCRKEVDSPWSWLVCLCSTIIVAMVFGVLLNFGILFPVLMDYFQETRERTAWVGSVGIACTFILGPLSSVITNRLGCRRTAFLGALLCIGSLLLSPLASQITLLYVTYSVPFGFGSSCLFVSCFVITSQYFHKKRAVATGIVASGTGIGVFALAPILQSLLNVFDWQNTYRITAGIFSIVCFLCLTFDPAVQKKAATRTEMVYNQVEIADKKPVERRADIPKKLLNLSIFKNKVFVVGTLSFTLAALGHHTPRLHLVKFSKDLNVSADAASELFIYIGITTFVARLLSGILNNVPCVNPVHVYMLGLVLDGSSVVFLSQAKNYVYLVVFSIFYGLADGLSIGSFNLIILNCVEPSKRASAFGMSGLFYGTTIATGPPLAGFMTDRLNTYIPSFIFAAAVEFVGAAMILFLICDKKRDLHNHAEFEETRLPDEQFELGEKL
ncbi:monocarboxylate transporter 10-like [Montipora capricornis]|uniref:monocarboxylate transporter 10-like n=1 Tax=Montipora capricornis TaxID=246305 RepID=UPI0035F2062E